MEYSCFIGTASSEPSKDNSIDSFKDFLNRTRLNYLWKNLLIGIDLGYDPYEGPQEVPVVIGDWRD